MKPDHRSSGHSVSPLYVHLVFVTKYRRRIFTDAMLTHCEDTLRDICTALRAELEEFNGEADHVHLPVQYPPAPAISELVRRLKGPTAPRMRADYTGRCNRARMHGHYWTPPTSPSPPVAHPGDHQAVHREPKPPRLTAETANPRLKPGACAEHKLGQLAVSPAEHGAGPDPRPSGPRAPTDSRSTPAT